MLKKIGLKIKKNKIRTFIITIMLLGIFCLFAILISPRLNNAAVNIIGMGYKSIFPKTPDLSAAKIRLREAAGKDISLPFANPLIVIHKREKIAELFDGDKLIKKYDVVFGAEPAGAKSRKGDEKTPEGVYHICTRLNKSRYHLFLGINYPNTKDAEKSLADNLIDKALSEDFMTAEKNRKCPDWKTAMGGAIGLHGGGVFGNWTDGCIAFTNESIEEIWLATSYWTMVRIEP